MFVKVEEAPDGREVWVNVERVAHITPIDLEGSFAKHYGLTKCVGSFSFLTIDKGITGFPVKGSPEDLAKLFSKSTT